MFDFVNWLYLYGKGVFFFLFSLLVFCSFFASKHTCIFLMYFVWPFLTINNL